ncbi:hypothetical protein HY989_04550 [Candidatus Micrarchaeota archaeon]|nr:hypothetical protein [Candidatus Micrarchaeota archaeon]
MYSNKMIYSEIQKTNKEMQELKRQFEGLLETFEIMTYDPKIMKEIARNWKEIRAGKYFTIEQVEKELKTRKN